MSLYTISEELNNFNFEIDEETGEVLNIDKLNDLQMAFDEKADNIIRFIKNLSSDCEALKNEEKALAERRKVKENKIKSLKGYLSNIMDFNGKDKLEYLSGVASFRKSKSVEIDDEFISWAMLNNYSEFIKYDNPTVNKTAVKEYLKTNECEFARIIENKNLGVK